MYLDSRSRPPEEAAHTWGGYSTGTWEGDILRIETTHLKEDYIRRNGAMMSDEAEVTTWWIRRGDYLTWVTIIHDPLYLAEPLIRSAEDKLNVNCARCRRTRARPSSRACPRAPCRTTCRVRIRS